MDERLTQGCACDDLALQLTEVEEALDAVPDLVSRFLPDSTLTYVNEAACQYFGVAREQVIGQPFLPHLPDEAREQVRRYLAIAASERRTVRYEYAVRDGAGRERWLEWSTRPLLDADGRVTGYLGIGRDVTERKAGETALGKRLGLEEAVSRGARRLLASNGRPQVVDGVLGILGWEVCVGRAYLFCCRTADDGSVQLDNVNEWCAEGVEPQIDYCQDTPADSVPWFYGRLTARQPVVVSGLDALPPEAKVERAMLEHQGVQAMLAVPVLSGDELLGFIGFDDVEGPREWEPGELGLLQVMADVFATYLQRERAVEALATAERRQRELIAQAPIGIVVVDRRGVILECNAAHLALEGIVDPALLVGKSALDVRSATDTAGADDLRRCLTEGVLVRRDCAYTNLGGREVHVRYTLSPTRDAAGEVEGALCLFEDVSEQALLEEQLRERSKMEAIGRLAGGVAHDFNNILASISGYSEMVLESLPSGDPRRADVREVIASVGRASRLTRQLLAFSRRELIAPRPVDANGIVRDMESMLRRLLGEDIDLVVQRQARAFIHADPPQIEQVLMNLVVNARDAMPDGGRLTVATRAVEVSEHGPGELEPGRYVALSVTDTGCGMSPETLTRIYEPFFTTKGVGQGTGLGLATVYGIVQQNGGHIACDTRPGAGTTFTVYLPAIEPPAVEVRRDPGTAEARGTGGPETILLVEDEPVLRRLAQRVLADRGYRLLAAGTAREAVALARDHQAEIELLVTDVVLPDGSGPDVARAIASMGLTVPVLYTSGYAGDVLGRHDMGEAGRCLLAKPFTPKQLMERVRQLLDAA